MRRSAVLRSVNRPTNSTPGKRFQISTRRFIGQSPASSLELRLACESTATCIALCWPVFVTRLDVIFRCDIKKHCLIPRFRYSVAALPITSITPRHNKSKSNLNPERAPRLSRTLLRQLDFGASHQPTIWHVQTLQRRSHSVPLSSTLNSNRSEKRFLRSERELSRAARFARCSQLPIVRNRKYWNKSGHAPHGAHADEVTSFTCPSAARTTAATTHSPHFPLQQQKHANEHTTGSCVRACVLCFSSRAFASGKCRLRRRPCTGTHGANLVAACRPNQDWSAVGVT
jgi:hypothetical protein